MPIASESRAAWRGQEELLLPNFAKNLVFTSGAETNIINRCHRGKAMPKQPVQTPSCASKPQNRALLALASSYTVLSCSILTLRCFYLSSATSPLSWLTPVPISHPSGHAPRAGFLSKISAAFCYPPTRSRRCSVTQERNSPGEALLRPAAGSPGLYKPPTHQLAGDVTTRIAFG